jgi:phage shock protein C
MSSDDRFERQERRERDRQQEADMSSGQFHWSKNPLRLYRDTKHGRIAGVCAGLAAYFDIRVRYVRLALILAAIFGFFPWIVAAYVILALVLKPMPDKIFESPKEEQFWRGVSASPNRATTMMKNRFRALDRRLSDIERRVTSEEFDLQQKFRDLKA